MKNQFELNQLLLNAVFDCDLAEAERLLKLGADPLGSSDEQNPDEHLLGEWFCEMRDYEALSANFPKFLQLFYTYGMDIAAQKIPTSDGNNIHPLWMLAFCQTEAGLQALHTMLEHGLDCDSAEVLVAHILMDMEMCDGCEIEDDWFRESVTCGLKMVMLTASYPHILNKSTYIQNCIELAKNDAKKLHEFRNWEDFDYDVDISTGTNVPYGLQNAALTIRDKRTGETVWTLAI